MIAGMGSMGDRLRRHGRTRREARAASHAGKGAGPRCAATGTALCDDRRCPSVPASRSFRQKAPSPIFRVVFRASPPPKSTNGVVYQKCSKLENRDFGRQLASEKGERAPGPSRIPADGAGVGWESMLDGTTWIPQKGHSVFTL